MSDEHEQTDDVDEDIEQVLEDRETMAGPVDFEGARADDESAEEDEDAASADDEHGHGGDGHGGDGHGGDGHDDEEHGGHGHGGGQGAALRQLAIVVALIVAMVVLHFFAVPHDERAFDPTAMVALGFVVLASFTIGALVDVIKLPHITGYLLAGMFFGPSIAGFIPYRLLPPFDEGVLNGDVIGQLSPLNTLAVALIALTAGGELRLDQLRKGLRAISGVLLVQLVTVMALVTGFFYLISGAIPAIALPGLGDVAGAWLPIGLTIGAVSFATSPAATIAIINETGSKGPMTRTVMSAVVLKDVVVVVLFGVFAAWAGQSLGQETEGSLAVKLAIEIGGSILEGILLGGLIALYMGFVGKEPMLFVAGMIYLATLASAELHLDAVLVFLTAGFLVSNFSKSGEKLIHSVEKLSMPVYVVFFTIAGASLHLDEVVDLAAFAVALTLVRVLAIYIGVKLGAIVGGADENTRKYGWMGFLSQAGVAITFASFLADPSRFPESIHALSGLLIAGVAINEVIGPVALKIALGLAGETAGSTSTHAAAPEAQAPSERAAFAPWPTHLEEVEWGNVDLDEAFAAAIYPIEQDLREIVDDVANGPMSEFEEDAEDFLKELRREFLRHHRRLAVHARTVSATESEQEEPSEDGRIEMARMLRAEQAELAERWRGIVLTRSVRITRTGQWSATEVVTSLDEAVDATPERVAVPYVDASFEASPNDGLFRSLARTGLRLRRGTSRLFGRTIGPRELPLRDLVRYHLSGLTPPRLEGIAALLVSSERHLVGRTRNLFDSIVHAYDALASAVDDPDIDLEDRVTKLRQEVEGALLLAMDEVQRMAKDGAHRTALILASSLRDIKTESQVYGTLDLPVWERRSSGAFKDRVRAIEQLGQEVETLRDSCGGEHALLAMELELVGLEARLKDLVAQHQTRLEGEIRRRAVQQATRVAETLEHTLDEVRAALKNESSAIGLGQRIRAITVPAEKVAGEAARITRELREELLDEGKLRPLVAAVTEAADSLTQRYDVIAGRMLRGEWKLPAPLPSVEVPFRELVLEHTETRVAPQLFSAARDASEELQPIALAMKEAERLIAFNTELATAELDVALDDAVADETRLLVREMLEGQLERSLMAIRSLREQSETMPVRFGRSIRGAVLGALDELRGQLVDGEITRAKLDEIRRSASRRRLAARARDFPTIWRDGWAQFRRAFRVLLGEERLERLRTTLGLPAPRAEVVLDPEAFAEPQTRATLPLVYRRLFAADTMEASDVLTGRDETIRDAREALTPQSGSSRSRAVALVGMDGVGKASVSGAIVRGGRWKSVKRLNLTRPMSVDEVDALLLECKSAQLVVLEGLHWMISSAPGGFEPLRRFVDGVLRDGVARSWLVHADEVFWRYAGAVAPLADAFPEVIQLAPLTVEELTAAVMERHRLSGYEHAFDRAQGESKIEGLVARGASRIRRPYEQYFADLHAATGGLVRDALRLWLASIRSIETGDLVHVGPVPSSGFVAVSRLPDAELLSLFQIARQGWMNADVLAYLMRSTPQSARARLARLRHLGLLEEDEGVHRVAVHLRGAVARVLRTKGWF